MEDQNETVFPIASRIQRLEELTHELSNKLGNSTNQISLAVLREGRDIPEDVLVAIQDSLRANETLRSLMWELYQLRVQLFGHTGPSWERIIGDDRDSDRRHPTSRENESGGA